MCCASFGIQNANRQGDIKVKDAIPGSVPTPAFQLLMFCILQSSVVKHHPYNALEIFGIQVWVLSQFPVVKETDFVRLACEKGVILASPPYGVHQDFLYPPTYKR